MAVDYYESHNPYFNRLTFAIDHAMDAMMYCIYVTILILID